MNDPALVRRLKCFADLTRDGQRLVERNAAVRDPIGQRRAFDKLEHEGLQGAGFFETVNRRDVWMVQ